MPDIIDLPLPAFADDARWQAYCRLGRAYNHELLGTTEWDDSPEAALIQAAAETDYTVHRCLALADGEPVGYGRSLVNHVDEPAADAYEVDACVRRRVLVTDPDDVATPRPAWAYVASDALTAAERIAVVGDSIVYGRDDPDGGWAGRLARHHGRADGRRFWNLAVPGLTLRELDRHADAETALRRADTVVVGAGINDLRAVEGPARPADVVAAMDALCTRLEAAGRRPVVLIPLWLDAPAADADFGMGVRLADAADLRERLVAWGAQTHRDVVDLWPVLEGRPERFTDGVHPDAAGHALLWERLRATMAP